MTENCSQIFCLLVSVSDDLLPMAKIAPYLYPQIKQVAVGGGLLAKLKLALSFEKDVVEPKLGG